MGGVSKNARRAFGMLAVLALLAAQSAYAGERNPVDARRFIDKAKRFIVSVLSRLGTPPGSPEPPP